jgi:epoxyqueuosine reductase
MDLNSFEVKNKALEMGFDLVGIAQVDGDNLAEQRLQTWLSLGYHADMQWMSYIQRQNVRLVMPEVKSIISVAINYYTDNQRPNSPEYGKISRYGWGRDYHKVLHKKLKNFSRWINDQGEGIISKYYADTGPIQDKIWAEKAGLGWIAKNGNLITRKYGSWVFLGEILTNLELIPDRPHSQHCGSCNNCINACPTQAITEPFVVDANKCIAYHTIENRAEKLPENIAKNLNNWVAGCDICQDVCPWNQRFAKETNHADFHPYPDNIAPKLTDLAIMTEEEWDKRFIGSALRRIKPPMWRRNAIANLENHHNSPNHSLSTGES